MSTSPCLYYIRFVISVSVNNEITRSSKQVVSDFLSTRRDNKTSDSVHFGLARQCGQYTTYQAPPVLLAGCRPIRPPTYLSVSTVDCVDHGREARFQEITYCHSKYRDILLRYELINVSVFASMMFRLHTDVRQTELLLGLQNNCNRYRPASITFGTRNIHLIFTFTFKYSIFAKCMKTNNRLK